MSALAVEVQGLFAGYGDRPVLHDISFSLPSGTAAALIGPNGAGKSTLLRCLAGLMRPRSGRVLIGGRDVARLPARLRARRLGVVAQHNELPFAFSVEEVVALGRGPHAQGWSRRDPGGGAAIERAMALTGVIDLRGRDARALSGGERQRVLFAMALAQEPEILLLDEAAAHLDLNHRQELMQIVERLNRETGMTLLLVSHDLDLAAACGERVLLLDRGRLAADGSPGEVLTATRLSATYGCEVSVQRLENGALHVRPALQSTALAHRGDELHVHLIGGGGTAETIMRCLRLAGYRLSAGVLNIQDSDADLARALDIPCALEKPFAPIGEAAFSAAERFVRRACAVVLAPAPFGPGNVRNLDLAALALRMGKTVLLAPGIADRDFSPGREAAARAQTLLDGGARTYDGLQSLLEALPRREPPVPGLKRTFPFRLGTTSHILPADILSNLRALAPRVDDVQLLIFASPGGLNLPEPSEVSEMALLARRHDLTLSVHLPADAALAHADPAIRARGIEDLKRVFERLSPLAPPAWILQLTPGPGPDPDSDPAAWRAAAAESLRALIEWGIPSRKLAVKTMDYAFETVRPLIECFDLGLCLDVGHLLLRVDDPEAFLKKHLERIRCIHLHSRRGGRDPADRSCLPEGLTADLVRAWKDAPDAPRRILTIDACNEADLNRSLERLRSEWFRKP